MFKRFIAFTFFISFVFLSILIGGHHHNDNKPHPECQVCLIQINVSSTDSPSFSIPIEYSTSILNPVKEKLIFFLTLPVFLVTRPPPVKLFN